MNFRKWERGERGGREGKGSERERKRKKRKERRGRRRGGQRPSGDGGSSSRRGLIQSQLRAAASPQLYKQTGHAGFSVSPPVPTHTTGPHNDIMWPKLQAPVMVFSNYW